MDINLKIEIPESRYHDIEPKEPAGDLRLLIEKFLTLKKLPKTIEINGFVIGKSKEKSESWVIKCLNILSRDKIHQHNILFYTLESLYLQSINESFYTKRVVVSDWFRKELIGLLNSRKENGKNKQRRTNKKKSNKRKGQH